MHQLCTQDAPSLYTELSLHTELRSKRHGSATVKQSGRIGGSRRPQYEAISLNGLSGHVGHGRQLLAAITRIMPASPDSVRTENPRSRSDADTHCGSSRNFR